MIPNDLPKPSESDLLGSAGVSPGVFGVPPNTRRRPAVNPPGETPSGATETVALPETHPVDGLVQGWNGNGRKFGSSTVVEPTKLVP